MISRKEDFSYLLDELNNISSQFYFKNGEIVDLNGEIIKDNSIINKIQFYLLYSYAFQNNDTDNFCANKDIMDHDLYQATILGSYDMFNCVINTFLKEYQLYGDIGTKNIVYFPYEKVFKFLLGIDNDRYEFSTSPKTIVANYLNTVFELEDCKKRVK